ncbi:succinyl-diaminopimelate desuccinylase [Helicobacter cetorum]|uniref:Succinyl-diaminopimelate desuccinylase n=1 Tax=Helicobacter cetorum (strain ATCC BAA-429 / MIT 00-7128) TaxID=182217 RepID=I0EP09_HELC0|nr:succinyl-diaminopimelate desuccinylase [Helicobacter cetorum]AFI04678.1 succinyl-diaminopimelate desuccinylase [Helicobacter cetorum MIT 00-7128]
MNALEITQKLISYPSITPKECGIFEYIKSLFPTFKVLECERDGVKNLFLYQVFNPKAGIKPLHFCFAGHIDVVPAGNNWQSEPFTPTIKEDFLYGRGAQDMKGGVGAFLGASLKFNPKTPFMLSILLTSDEEGPGIFGTKLMLEQLKEKDLLPDMVIVAEPTCEKILGDSIKIGRRGSINGKLILKGIQGHAAYPEKCKNPIDSLASVLPLISGVNLDNGDENFAPSKLVITNLHAGLGANNVTPASVEILFNVRHSLKTTKESLKEYLEKVLKDLSYFLELEQSSLAFITSSHSKLINVLKENILKICNITPSLNTKGGTSDARFFSAYGIEVVEFGVINDRIHAIDERVSLKELEFLEKVFLGVLESLSQ